MNLCDYQIIKAVIHVTKLVWVAYYMHLGKQNKDIN